MAEQKAKWVSMSCCVTCVDLKICLNEGLVECNWISASSNTSRSVPVTAGGADPTPNCLTPREDKNGDTPTFRGQCIEYNREVGRRVLQPTMERSDDGRDNVWASDDGLVVPFVIQEDVECNLVYVLVPSIG